MLFQVIFMFSLRHTIRAREYAKALIIHDICTKLTEIQWINLYSVLIRIGGCCTKEVSIYLWKSLSRVRHLVQSLCSPNLSDRCGNILKAACNSRILLKSRVELAHELRSIR